MKIKNIIAEAFDLTALQGTVASLRKSYEEMGKSIQSNPLLSKEFAPQMSNMTATVSGIEKIIANMSVEQKTEFAAAAKQQQVNQQNQAKPGTTQSLSKQAVPAAAPIPAKAPTAPTAPVAPAR